MIRPHPPRAAPAGFTLVELMTTAAVVGLLAALAVSRFSRYVARSRTAEAVGNVRVMFDAGLAYHATVHHTTDGVRLPPQFPMAAGVPGKNVLHPAAGCCAEPGHLCSPATYAAEWTQASMEALHFSVETPFHYSYTTCHGGCATIAGYIMSGAVADAYAPGAKVGDTMHWAAAGDLNCNTVLSVFDRAATVAPDGTPRGAPLAITRELE